MSREIKFRSWVQSSERQQNINMMRYENNATLFGWEQEDGVAQVLMQFTGLKDKNGKEIYEGDVVRILYSDWPSKTDDSVSHEDYKKSISSIGYVAWDEHSTGWILKVKSKMSVNDEGTVMTSIVHGPHGEREVIGNIYEGVRGR